MDGATGLRLIQDLMEGQSSDGQGTGVSAKTGGGACW